MQSFGIIYYKGTVVLIGYRVSCHSLVEGLPSIYGLDNAGRLVVKTRIFDNITNDAVRDRIRQAIGPYDDISTTVKKRK